jgi:hypothetical protein
MIYPEREQKLTSLSREERGDLIFVLFDFYRFMEHNPNNPVGFEHDLFNNRVIKLSFDTIKEQIVNDYESYKLRVIRNQEN